METNSLSLRSGLLQAQAVCVFQKYQSPADGGTLLF
jgi:hypothetical protein